MDNQYQKMTSAQITMIGFDYETIDFLKRKFDGINVSVTIIVNEMLTFPCDKPWYKGE